MAAIPPMSSQAAADGKPETPTSPVVYKSPVIFCVTVLIYENYAYNLVFLARILPEADKGIYIPLFALIFNVAWLITIWAYGFVHFSDPGSITDSWRAFVQNTNGLDVIVSRQEWQPGKVTTNKKSPEIRPERAHFCSTTSKDILRMDHFCPWTGNTVGFENHKHFLLLGFYGALSGAIGFFSTLPELLGLVAGNGSVNLQSMEVSVKIQFFIFAFFAAVVMVLLTGLFVSHFPLACRNMTTIEELYVNMPNPYDQQKWFKNLEQVFGRFGWDWFLPVRARVPMSDGMSFRRNGELLPEGLVEIYGQANQKRADDDIESVLTHRIPEDIWYYRYTGRDPKQKPDQDSRGNENNTSWLHSSLAWMTGG